MNPDYKAAREGSAFLDLSNRGKIEVTGADRVSFLHNILTNDIKNLKSGEFCPAALLSAPAKVLALMNVWKFEDKILLDTEPGLEEKLLGLLDKFLITEDASLRIATSEYAHFSLKGKSPGIILTSSEKKQAVLEKFTTSGVVEIGSETAEILRIEEGVLQYGVDVTEDISLPETGLDDLYASETKGCYPGQEVVARTKTYKGLQRKMTKLVILSDPKGPLCGAKDLARFFGLWPQNDTLRGSKIFSDGNEIGWVTSVCLSPTLGGIGLGYVRKGFFEKSADLEIKTRTTLIRAKSTPFFGNDRLQSFEKDENI